MINCLIFSKNRACQLELLLRSIEDNLPELNNITVLYKSTNENFDSGYEKLIKKYKKVNFIKEKDFVPDVKRIVSSFTDKYSLTLVDDSVVINNTDLIRSLSILNDPLVHCISLRMNPYINYTYSTNIKSEPPDFIRSNVAGTILYKWKWREENPRTDFGYPSCIDGHVYLTEFFKYMVKELKFNSINNLEEMIDQNRNIFKLYMVCFDKTIVLTIPNNLVQTTHINNRSGKSSEYSLESLNKKFLDGFCISSEGIYNFNNKSAHVEVPYKIVKRN